MSLYKQGLQDDLARLGAGTIEVKGPPAGEQARRGFWWAVGWTGGVAATGVVVGTAIDAIMRRSKRRAT